MPESEPTAEPAAQERIEARLGLLERRLRLVVLALPAIVLAIGTVGFALGSHLLPHGVVPAENGARIRYEEIQANRFTLVKKGTSQTLGSFEEAFAGDGARLIIHSARGPGEAELGVNPVVSSLKLSAGDKITSAGLNANTEYAAFELNDERALSTRRFLWGSTGGPLTGGPEFRVDGPMGAAEFRVIDRGPQVVLLDDRRNERAVLGVCTLSKKNGIDELRPASSFVLVGENGKVLHLAP